jgi:hypothetical protein
VYKRVIPNGGHQALRAKKPCSARAPKPERRPVPCRALAQAPTPAADFCCPKAPHGIDRCFLHLGDEDLHRRRSHAPEKPCMALLYGCLFFYRVEDRDGTDP